MGLFEKLQQAITTKVKAALAACPDNPGAVVDHVNMVLSWLPAAEFIALYMTGFANDGDSVWRLTLFNEDLATSVQFLVKGTELHDVENDDDFNPIFDFLYTAECVDEKDPSQKRSIIDELEFTLPPATLFRSVMIGRDSVRLNPDTCEESTLVIQWKEPVEELVNDAT